MSRNCARFAQDQMKRTNTLLWLKMKPYGKLAQTDWSAQQILSNRKSLKMYDNINVSFRFARDLAGRNWLGALCLTSDGIYQSPSSRPIYLTAYAPRHEWVKYASTHSITDICTWLVSCSECLISGEEIPVTHSWCEPGRGKKSFRPPVTETRIENL